jgi:hypothetical protein
VRQRRACQDEPQGQRTPPFADREARASSPLARRASGHSPEIERSASRASRSSPSGARRTARLVVGTDDPEGRHVVAHRKRWAWQQNQAWTQGEPDVGSWRAAVRVPLVEGHERCVGAAGERPYRRGTRPVDTPHARWHGTTEGTRGAWPIDDAARFTRMGPNCAPLPARAARRAGLRWSRAEMRA